MDFQCGAHFTYRWFSLRKRKGHLRAANVTGGLVIFFFFFLRTDVNIFNGLTTYANEIRDCVGNLSKRLKFNSSRLLR